MAEHTEAALPATPGDGGHDPLLSTTHRDQCHHVLRARALPDHRLHQRCRTLLGRHYWRRQCAGHVCVHRGGRQSRAPYPLLGGRGSDVHLAGNKRKKSEQRQYVERASECKLGTTFFLDPKRCGRMDGFSFDFLELFELHLAFCCLFCLAVLSF